MFFLCVLLVFGPAETIAGKYVRHSAEYLAEYPVPDVGVHPRDVDGLCRLIEAGRDGPEMFAELGDRLREGGDKALAYRAFHRAHRAKPDDPKWGRAMQERKYACGVVSHDLIRAEEREAKVWVDAFQSWERERIRGGKDPHELATFYERYGRPESDLWSHARARQLSWAGGVCGILVGFGFMLASGIVRRRTAWLPALVGVACLLGPVALGQRGLFWIGAAVSFLGAALVLSRGKTA